MAPDGRRGRCGVDWSIVTTGTAVLAAAAAIACVMIATWLLSLPLHNASIVDIVWGLGFVVVAWVVRLQGDTNEARQWLLVAMVTLWGLRLAGYLFWRNHGAPEDYRYRAMRKRWGPRFPIISLATVFTLQGVLMWIVSLPVQLGQVSDGDGIGVFAVIGTVLWVIGICFETVGDIQLARFKADAANAGRVMDRGLWRYTRHPNYFGDACVWWGIGLVAVESGLGPVARVACLVGPSVMTVLLLKVSGVALLERSLQQRKPEYAAYAARTSAFVPRPPKRI
jgi:steroid 5-alpha reductase family enzyme